MSLLLLSLSILIAIVFGLYGHVVGMAYWSIISLLQAISLKNRS